MAVEVTFTARFIKRFTIFPSVVQFRGVARFSAVAAPRLQLLVFIRLV